MLQFYFERTMLVLLKPSKTVERNRGDNVMQEIECRTFFITAYDMIVGLLTINEILLFPSQKKKEREKKRGDSIMQEIKWMTSNDRK